MSYAALAVSGNGVRVPGWVPTSLIVTSRLGERGELRLAVRSPISTFTNQPANDSIEFFSSDDNDTAFMILTGLNNADVLSTATVQLSGQTVVTSTLATNNWKTLYMVWVTAAHAGTITLREASGNLTITTISPSTSVQIATFPWSAGDEFEVTTFTNQPNNDGLELYSSEAGDAGINVTIIGTDNSDALQYEVKALDGSNGTTPVSTVRTDWKTIHEICPETMAGTLTVREASGNLTVTTVAAGVAGKRNRLFGGIAEDIAPSYVGSGNTALAEWWITATDYRQVLDRRVVTQTYTDTTVANILSDLQTDITGSGKEGFLTSWGGANTYDAAVGSTVVQGETEYFCTVSDLLDACAEAANAKWWIGPYKQIYMRAVSGGELTPFAPTTATAIWDVRASTNTAKYQNRQYVAYNALTASVSETLVANESTSSNSRAYLLRYPVGTTPVIGVDVAGYGSNPVTAKVAQRGTDDLAIWSGQGLGFTNHPADTDLKSYVVSTDGTDTGGPIAYVAYTTSGDAANVKAFTLTGTTPVSSGATNTPYILGMWLSEPCSGTVYCKRETDDAIICSIAPGGEETGVARAADMTNENGLRVQLSAVADNTCTDKLGIGYYKWDDPGLAGSIAYDSVSMDGVSAVDLPRSASESVADVVYLFYGMIASARTVTVTAPYEWNWNFREITISRTAKSYTLPDVTNITVTYQGTYPAYASAVNASQQAARAAQEDGTGYWDAAYVTEQAMSTAAATALAADMLDRYDALQQELSFATWLTDWYVGQYRSVTISQFGLSAVTMVVSEVTISEAPGTRTELTYRLVHRIRMTTRTIYGGDAGFWRRALRRQNISPNTPRVST